MRNRFDEQLFKLNHEMVEMGALCEEAITQVVAALTKNNRVIAEEVIQNSTAIDQLERNIENRCMKLLLHQQPVASDLRKISAALKMITDMERIGDQAENIAEIVLRLDGQPTDNVQHIETMANATSKMVTTSVEAFVKKDIKLAKNVLTLDDTVDDYFFRVKNDIISLMMNQPQQSEFGLDLLMIAKYLERIGDHATNIAEWVMYSITGNHKGEHG